MSIAKDSELSALAALSARIGRDPLLAQASSGNTSIKLREAMWIKASGKWLIDAILRRDYPVVQGGILLIATGVILVNLLVDVLYGVVNPRIRH